jgi:hypothetical protein
MKDLKNHHAQLLTELDILVEDRNILQEKLSKAARQTNSSNDILLQIDEWQRTTTEKIKQAADQARQQVTNILDSKCSEITVSFEKFSKELVHLKETEDLYHDDLSRLQQTMLQLDEDLKQLAQPPTILICTEQTNQVVWNHLIYVDQKITNVKNQQQQQQTAGERRNNSVALTF